MLEAMKYVKHVETSKTAIMLDSLSVLEDFGGRKWFLRVHPLILNIRAIRNTTKGC